MQELSFRKIQEISLLAHELEVSPDDLIEALIKHVYNESVTDVAANFLITESLNDLSLSRTLE